MKKGLAEYANMSPGQRPVIARETFRDISDIRRVTSDGKITYVPCPECGRTLSNGEWLSLGAGRKNNICTWPGARGSTSCRWSASAPLRHR